MAIKTWIDLVCSECSESFMGAVPRDDFNANTLRKEARKKGCLADCRSMFGRNC
jgi:hypothetical protein